MYQILEICGIPGMGGCINDSQKVIDGHYPHVEMHSSSLSFWQKGLSSDMGKSWMGKRTGNSSQLAWEKTSQSDGSASHPNAALFQQFKREGQMRSWGSF